MFCDARCSAVLLLVGLPVLGAAQTAVPAANWVEGLTLVREGVKLHDQENYASAVAKYEAVLPSDSAYALAQSELALSLLASKQHEAAVAAARRALALNPDEPQTYNSLANAYDELKRPAEAVATYEQGLRRFPYNQSLYFNLGVALLRQNKVAEAVAALQRSAELRPLHKATHQMLGAAAAMQGHPSHALMSWLLCLALADNGPSSQELLVKAERLSMGAAADEKERVPAVTPNAAFAELDQLIESKVALQKGYTSKVKFNAAVVKQAQLLVEKFPVDGPADDFWVRAYGPLVRALRQGDNLTAFTYLALQSASDQSAAKWTKANKSKVDALVTTALVPYQELRQLQPRPGAAAAAGPRLAAWFDDDGDPAGLGPGTVEKGEFRGTGEWIGLNSGGAVVAQGQYAGGKPSGAWRRLRPDGSLARTYAYNAAGEEDDPSRYFYEGGQMSSEATYKNGKLDGVLTRLDRCGNRLAAQTYRAGELEGPYTDYFPDGQVKFRVTSKADKGDGPEERFYPNGNPDFADVYVNGKEQGPFSGFYADKTPNRKGAYEAGEFQGPYTTYHPNGAVNEAGTMSHGKRSGTWRETYASGQTSAEKSYDDAGLLHGPYRDYDHLGRLFVITEYAHGRVARVQYLDRAGKVVLDQPIKKGTTAVRMLDSEGRPRGTGAYLNGNMEGEWTWLYADGTVRERGQYRDGRKSGRTETYHPNGKLKERGSYDAQGERDGYVEVFGANGRRLQTGYYRSGKQVGPWREYYSTGVLKEESFYHKGVPNGLVRNYVPGGQLAQERTIKFDDLTALAAFDSTGKALSRCEFKADTKELALRYASGQVLYQAAQRCGDSYGPAAWLRPDGSAISRFTQLNNRREGDYKAYYPGGQVEVAGRYCNGDRLGPWAAYYPNGQVESQGGYNTAGAQGEWTFYFANGKPRVVQGYLNGEDHGVLRRYNPAGELLLELRYERGSLLEYRGPGPENAPWLPVPAGRSTLRTTFANGKPAAEETYHLGELDGTSTYYYASGEVYRRTARQNGELNGLDEAFWPGGKPMWTRPYLDDQRHGRSREYRPDGTPEREESHRCGVLTGPTVYYNAAGQPTRTDVYWNDMLVK